MSDTSNSDVGMGEQHAPVPDRTEFSFATTEDESKLNTIRIPIVPVACWRLNRPGFAFDSSFVDPVFRKAIARLQEIVDSNPNCPAALFGHCDPAGSDELNKTLGDRRAIAIYALLTHQPAMWADLYDHPQVGDNWGVDVLQLMLRSLTDKQGNSYYGVDHAIDGIYGSGTTAAVKSFQSNTPGLAASGQADAATRKALFAAYMEFLCTPEAPAGAAPGLAFRMRTSDFLGGGAEGELPKMSLQGCSEFNPVVLLPASEMNSNGSTAQRDSDNAPNRRIVMFFFKQGTTVGSAAWPCPKVKEPLTGCKAAFWPDGEARRKNGKDVREYKKTHDTMACRFYDRFARRSPCERSYFSFLDFFVYLGDQDGSQATNTIDAKWGDQLRLGWIVSGTVKQVQIANTATGAKGDVTFATGPTGDGYSMGWVPLCVVAGAANTDGLAEYQLVVTWPNGRTNEEHRVQVRMSGENGEHETWVFGPVCNVAEAEVMGLGGSFPVPSQTGGE